MLPSSGYNIQIDKLPKIFTRHSKVHFRREQRVGGRARDDPQVVEGVWRGAGAVDYKVD